MLERPMIAGEYDPEDSALAMALLETSERYVRAGLLSQAELLLQNVWLLAEGQSFELANYAAWELACLFICRGAYPEAITWLGRVEAPLMRSSQLWPATRTILVDIMSKINIKATELSMTMPVSYERSVSVYNPEAAQLPALKMINLGRFEIIRAGQALPSCPAHKAIALFRYLLTRHHYTAHKEELMELLWPNTAVKEATNSLHVAVSTVRRYLDTPIGSYLLFNDGFYTINPDASIEDDCALFLQLCDQGQQDWTKHDLPQAEQAYVRAIECYQGDYCVNATDLDWAVIRQEQLLARFLMSLDHLGRIYMKQQRFEPAVECYQRLLERDSYREDACAQLMRCYWQLQRRWDAIHQYNRCATVLAHDLGIEPNAEIQMLYRAIFSGEQPASFAQGYTIHSRAYKQC